VLLRDLMTAFALMLIIEGLLPFFAPRFWQRAMRDLSGVNPKSIRIGGIIALLAGATLLQFIR
jgi:uncharacterized protein YjeT (DUF2065 family)